MGKPPSQPAPRLAWVSRATLGVAAVTTALAIAGASTLPNTVHVALVVTACGAYASMLAAEHRWGGLTIGLVGASGGLTVAVAMAGRAHFTGDLWSYAMYGRMVAAHHASPYSHVPANFPTDPILRHVGRGWRHTPSVYGPAFTALSAVAAVFTGAAAHTTRLFYQAVATAAVGASGLLIWRRTHSPAAVAFLTVHPMIAMFVLSGARNDILVGVAMLGAALLLERGHATSSGIAAGLGALVKLTGVVGLAALTVTALAHRAPRAAGRVLLGGGAVISLGYLAVGPSALFTPMRTAGALYSRASPWQLAHAADLRLPDPHVALAVLAGLVALVLLRHARGPISDAVAAPLAMLGLGASWVLPGYAAWALPTAALDHRSRVARLAAAGGLAVVLVYELLRNPIPHGDVLLQTVAIAGPLVIAVLVFGLALTRATRPNRSLPMPDPALLDLLRPPVPMLRTLVVVPTLNEEPNLTALLTRLRKAVPHAHVLVVDDGSADGTTELADALAASLGQIRVLRRTGPRGLGPAYREGFALGLAEGFEVLVQMDADLSHDPLDLPALLTAIERGADLAIGSRYVEGGLTVGWPARRQALSRAGGWYARRLLGSSVQDITAGYRAYRADLLRALDLSSITATGYGFQIEMTDRATAIGARVVEVPIVFRERVAGASKLSPRIVAEAMVMVARTAVRDRRAPAPQPSAARPLAVGNELNAGTPS
jgi:dolichol-phosphate mannosyltransferase